MPRSPLAPYRSSARADVLAAAWHLLPHVASWPLSAPTKRDSSRYHATCLARPDLNIPTAFPRPRNDAFSNGQPYLSRGALHEDASPDSQDIASPENALQAGTLSPVTSMAEGLAYFCGIGSSDTESGQALASVAAPVTIASHGRLFDASGDAMDAADRIRVARRHAKLSQEGLAKAVGVQRSAASQWESSGVKRPR